MKLTRFVNANIDMSDLTALDLLEPYLLPDANCKLIKFNPKFIDEIVHNKWKTILKKQLPPDVSFDDQTFSPTALFGELLRIAINSHQPSSFVRETWGFDSAHLPDIKYLLGAIALWDHESPFIRALPRKNQPIKTEFQENYEKAKLMQVVAKLSSGQPIRTRLTSDIPKELQEHLKYCTDLGVAYHVVHVERKEQLHQAGRLLALSKTNDAIRAIVQEEGYLQLLTNSDFGLVEEERAQAKSLIRAMEIESSTNLPDQQSNQSPIGATPREIQKVRQVLQDRSDKILAGKPLFEEVTAPRNIIENRFGDILDLKAPKPATPIGVKTEQTKPRSLEPKDKQKKDIYRPRITKGS